MVLRVLRWQVPRRRQVIALLVATTLASMFAASSGATETRHGQTKAALQALIPPVHNNAICFVYRSKPSQSSLEVNSTQSIAFGVLVFRETPNYFRYMFRLKVRTSQEPEALFAGGDCFEDTDATSKSRGPVLLCAAECDGGRLTAKGYRGRQTLVLDLGTFLGQDLGCAGSEDHTITSRDQPKEGFRLTRARLAECWRDERNLIEVKP